MTTATRLPPGWELREVDGVGMLLPERPSFETLSALAVPMLVRAQPPAEADPSEPVIDLIGSVQTVDEYETVFVQRGMDSSDFDANPVFLRQHAGDEPPLGLIEKHWATTIKARVRRDNKSVQEEVPATTFRVRFDVAEDEADDDAFQARNRAYLGLYRRRVMRAASIRFAPIRGEVLFGDEMTEKERAKWGITEYGIVFRKWRLRELSAVVLPGNVNALMRGLPRDQELNRAFDRIADLERAVRDLTETGSTRSVDPAPLGPDEPQSSLGHAHEDQGRGTPDGADPAEPHALSSGEPGLSPNELSDTLARLREIRNRR